MNDININDKSNFFSEIFKNYQDVDSKNDDLEEKFVSTEKWLEQLSRRITS